MPKYFNSIIQIWMVLEKRNEVRVGNLLLRKYSPVNAQRNESVMGEYNDSGSCFNLHKQNAHHPSIIQKQGWSYIGVLWNGKKVARFFAKRKGGKILIFNIYGDIRKGGIEIEDYITPRNWFCYLNQGYILKIKNIGGVR